MKFNLASFYDNSKRLKYNPASTVSNKRTGIKGLIAFDDRFEEVKKELGVLINLIQNTPIKVLDIGIGDGVYEMNLEENYKERCEFYGIDISAIQINRSKKILKGAKIVDLNLQKIPYKDNSFDIVIASEILEHVFYPEKVLKEAQRVLKSSGFLFLTFPNSACLHLRLGLLLAGSSPLLNYPKNAEHIRFFTSSDIRKIAGSNMKLLKKRGLGSLFFDRWNFFLKFPIPRVLQVLSNNLLPDLALGNLLIFQKE